MRTAVALAVPAAVVLAAGGYAGAVAATPGPRTAVRVLVPATVTVPGAAPAVGWRGVASGLLDVDGAGPFAAATPQRGVPIGSVAKVMTAYLVLRAHPLAPGAAGPSIRVTAADVRDYRRRAGSGQSLLPVVAGERLTEREALEAVLVPSANNIARLLARWSAGSVGAFVAQMNRTAAALGMTSTRYTDPSGYDEHTVSSAADQVRLAQRAMGDPTFAGLVALRHVFLPRLGDVRNYNLLLGRLGVTGVKTGSTDAAGGNLVFTSRLVAGGRVVTLTGAVLGVDVGRPPLDALRTAIARARAALVAARAAVGDVALAPSGRQVATLRAAWAAAVPVRTSRNLTVLGWPGRRFRLTLRLGAPRSAAPGEVVGTLTARPVTAADPAAVAVPVTTGRRLPAPGLAWRLLHP